MPIRSASPGDWHDFHAGLALAHAGDAGAAQHLRRAHAGMLASADARGRRLCAAALVVDAQAGGDVLEFAAWLDELRTIRPEPPAAEVAADELLALTALLIGRLFFELGDPVVGRDVERIVDLLEPEVDVNVVLAAAGTLMYHVEARELDDLGQRVFARVQPRLAEPALTPYRRARWSPAWGRGSGKGIRHAGGLDGRGLIRGRCLLDEAHARLAVDDLNGARARAEVALPLLPAEVALAVREEIAMIAAFESLARGEPEGRASMAAAWAAWRARRFGGGFSDQPGFCARLCMLALDLGIEVDFVTRVILERRLAAPAGAPENWPFALRIHALGQFALERGGQPIAMEGKGQRKPLELLRVLVAHGATRPGTAMQAELLIDMLWPDLDAEAPKASFDMTLMRLRKLLQVEGALRLAEGRLWLDPGIVWCDVAAFEQDCAALHTSFDTPGNELRLSAAARRLRSRRGNKLFGNTAVDPWSVVPRERLARQFDQAVTAYGQHLEAQGAWIAAISLYEQGLADDVFAEPWYRGLMRCHLALDHPSAAVRCFQRCRELLASVLKVRPSADTLALVDRIPSL